MKIVRAWNLNPALDDASNERIVPNLKLHPLRRLSRKFVNHTRAVAVVKVAMVWVLQWVMQCPNFHHCAHWLARRGFTSVPLHRQPAFNAQ
jgi:hypothetical protein